MYITALCRSWNRWLAEVWHQCRGRLRWSCVVPTMLLDEALVQMRTAKAHGAYARGVGPVDENLVKVPGAIFRFPLLTL